ncbi:hypothetical protein [uncultured Methanolobus sp.]|uniref:hypothetical protein n=1 Tax=uncultured Methanolobus sp. TaxID=218300 RepID=UPI0029C72181|nr:hypothetical protein [uncultured Methanolobus sp.]
MGLLSRMNLGGLIGGGGFGGASGSRGGKPFPRTLNLKNFTSANRECKAGEWTKLGEYIVPFQNEISWGQGQENIPDTLGFVYVDLHDDTATTAVQVEGLIRFVQKTGNDTDDKIALEERTEMLRGSKTDKKNKVALPLQSQLPRVGAQSKLVIEIMTDEDITIDLTPDSGETTILAPVTVYQ